jgi:hypothetical protein
MMNIMDHDDDDLVGANDEDDVFEEYDNEAYEDVMRSLVDNDPTLTSLSVMRILVDNDPTLTSLSVGFGGTVYPSNAIDWGSLGRAIGMNAQLIKLILCNRLPTDEHELTSFFSGLAVNRSIQTLRFDCIELNDEMIELMAPFLADNHVFKCLEVVVNDGNEMTQLCLVSFLLMFDYLKEFTLFDEREDNDYFDVVIQALAAHTGLKKLVLWGVYIGRRGRDSLVKLLNKSTKLKEIALANILGITNDGWLDIFTALRSTRCKLEKIELRGVEGVNERTALCISAALLHHSTTLKDLGLNLQVMVVIPLLQDPNTILEELTLESDNDDYSMTNEDIVVLTDALATNNTLKRLWLCGVRGGYAAFTHTLCNKSSIRSTYHSNHTLNMLYDREYTLSHDSMLWPEELTSLLQINKENNKNQAARLKIIKTHFSGNDIKMEPFTKIAVSVRPHAIAWMAKDMHLYEFLRAMPSLLEKGRKD